MDVANDGRRPAIPAPTVARLPTYLRSLTALAERAVETVSSSDLSLEVGVNAATLRRDLSRLGSVGTRGTGYDVGLLLRRVEAALALDRQWPIAIVGVGNLGRALARSHGFNTQGFRVAALIDVDPAVVATKLGELVVASLDEIDDVVRAHSIKIGVVATPASAAGDVARRFVGAGITTILNFAPTILAVPEHVMVRHVDLGVELQVLAYYGARSLGRRDGPV